MKFLLVFLALCPFSALAGQSSFLLREDVQAFVADMRERNGFESEYLLKLFAKASELPAVVKAIQPPVEPGIRSWQKYRSRFVEPRRIAAGLTFWQRHAATLAKAEARYGVPADIIVGIIGVETMYGKHTGRFQTFSALATLAFDYPPRAALFRLELESLLLLSRDEGRDPLSFRGSYAGAMGLPQFMPSSMRQWAVDFDSDGKIDLAESPEDAIGSVANFLACHGWQKEGPILIPVQAEGDRINELLTEGIKPNRLPMELADFGIKIADAPALPVALIDYVTPNEPTTYQLGYNNFYVITRYNKSTFYATAVHDLALSIRDRFNALYR